MKVRILELDVLRGFAAIGVVLAHFIPVANPASFSFNIGYLGIDLFFIISGFVISWTATNNPNWKHFIANRFSRIFPTYWFAVLFTSFLLFYSNNFSLLIPKESYELTSNLFFKMVVNLSMIQYYFRVSDIDGQYWTMVIELTFYALLVVLLLLKKLTS
jgi:peptidoglycan/LPS O-acetylase OafA/YrhL